MALVSKQPLADTSIVRDWRIVEFQQVCLLPYHLQRSNRLQPGMDFLALRLVRVIVVTNFESMVLERPFLISNSSIGDKHDVGIEQFYRFPFNNRSPWKLRKCTDLLRIERFRFQFLFQF